VSCSGLISLNDIVEKIINKIEIKTINIEENIKNIVLKTKTPIFKNALINGANSLKGNKKTLVKVFSGLFRFFVFF
jgi:CBS domain containing-hemolysin-like protein